MVDYPFVTSAGPHSFVIPGPIPAGSFINVNWTGASKTVAGCGQYGYAIQVNNVRVPGDVIQDVTSQTYPEGVATPHGIQLLAAHDGDQVAVDFFTDRYCSPGTAHGVTFSVSRPLPCAFGSRLKPGFDATTALSPNLIDIILDIYGKTAWRIAFAAFSWAFLNSAELCQSLPPVVPQGPANLNEWSRDALWNLFQALAWNYFCECSPGTPSPTPPAPPNITYIVNPPQVTLQPCANVDPCAALTRIEQALVGITQTLGLDYELNTIMQRFGQPFASVPGRTFSGLTGEGVLSIDRLIGIDITVGDDPALYRQLEGVPRYLWDVGWISILTGDGMIEEQRLTRAHQVWTPQLMPYATTLGFHVKDGHVINLTELKPEP